MNLNAFPFYASKLQQARYTVPGYAYAMPLYTPQNRLLPFMLEKPADGKMIDCIKIHNAETDALVYTLMGNAFSYEYVSDGLKDYIIYHGAILPVTMGCGAYYAELQGFYSEVFTVAGNTADLLKIEWRNTQNVGNIIYQTGYMQRVFLDSETAQPEYDYEQEGDENGAGVFLPQRRQLRKVVTAEAGLLAPFLADALAALALHDTVHIGTYASVKEVRAKASYPENSLPLLPLLSIEFAETEPVITKVCQEPLILTSLDPGGYSPAGWLCGMPDVTERWEPTGNVRCVEA